MGEEAAIRRFFPFSFKNHTGKGNEESPSALAGFMF
jgi:hypothetical protein